MSILQYFSCQLPCSNDTAIVEVATREANDRVKRVLENQQSQQGKKSHTQFTDRDRTEIGKHASENGNSSAQCHFKSKFPDLEESTVRSFKKKYLVGVARGENVTSIPSKKTGRPLTLGKIDGDVQSYIKSLRAAGTPIPAPVVIAAAKGIVQARDRTLLADHGGSILLNQSWAVSLMRWDMRGGKQQLRRSIKSLKISTRSCN